MYSILDNDKGKREKTRKGYEGVQFREGRLGKTSLKWYLSKKVAGGATWVNGGRPVQAEGTARADAQCQKHSRLVEDQQGEEGNGRHEDKVVRRNVIWGLGRLFVRTLALYSKWHRNLGYFEHISDTIQPVLQNHSGKSQLRRVPGDRDRSKEVDTIVQSLDQGGYGRCGKKHLDSENTWRCRCWNFLMD